MAAIIELANLNQVGQEKVVIDSNSSTKGPGQGQGQRLWGQDLHLNRLEDNHRQLSQRPLLIITQKGARGLASTTVIELMSRLSKVRSDEIVREDLKSCTRL